MGEIQDEKNSALRKRSKGLHHVNSLDEWIDMLTESKKRDIPLIAKFTAVWCGPCKKIAPVFEDLASASKMLFVEIDVDKCKDLSTTAQVKAMPTFQVYHGATQLDVLLGADEDKLRALVSKHS